MTGLDVHMAGDDIVVTDPASDFVAIYHKPTREPWLKLKQRTLTKDYVLYASAFKAANDKARELGGLYRGLRVSIWQAALVKPAMKFSTQTTPHWLRL